MTVLAVALGVVGFNVRTPTIGAVPVSFTVTGSGWGHGVGMSQWGARGRAANLGETYDQILRHYYTGTTVSTSATISDNVRVLVADSQNTVTLRTSGPTGFASGVTSLGALGAGATVTVTRSGARIALSGSLQGIIDPPLRVDLGTADGPVSVSGADSYRYGTLSIDTNTASGLRTVVGSLTMQQYLYGLGEVPSSWPLEALKAQATAARTFAQKQIGARRSSPSYADYDLNANMDGAYRGTRYEGGSYSRWVDAVDSTAGKVVLYGGALIDAVFSASSGGYTSESETVWVATVPYLRAVADSDDLTGGNPHASWSATYSGEELGSWFGLGTMTSVDVTGAVPPSKHLDKTSITLVGTTGSKTVTGAQFRNTINAKAGSSRVVKSTMFTLAGAGSGPGSGGPTPTSAPPSTPTTTVPSPTPRYTPATGQWLVARADDRRITVSGTAIDPDGPPLVRVVSTMGRERAVRDYRPTGGRFMSTWTGSPGTRNVCVTLFDNPTGVATSLGCRDVIVK